MGVGRVRGVSSFEKNKGPQCGKHREHHGEDEGTLATDVIDGQGRQEETSDMARNQRTEMPEEGRGQASLNVEWQRPSLRRPCPDPVKLRDHIDAFSLIAKF